jgi:hypothetical protein
VVFHFVFSLSWYYVNEVKRANRHSVESRRHGGRISRAFDSLSLTSGDIGERLRSCVNVRKSKPHPQSILLKHIDLEVYPLIASSRVHEFGIGRLSLTLDGVGVGGAGGGGEGGHFVFAHESNIGLFQGKVKGHQPLGQLAQGPQALANMWRISTESKL